MAFVDDRITVKFTLALTSCAFTSNYAKTSGSIAYLSSTASDSVTIVAGT